MKSMEEWESFLDNASVGLHCVDEEGIILWANQTELDFLGYTPEDYLGKFIGDFHVDDPIISDILGRLTSGATLNAYPARLRAKDGSVKYVIINSNVYREDGEFRHTRCFTTGIAEGAWKALRAAMLSEDPSLPNLPMTA